MADDASQKDMAMVSLLDEIRGYLKAEKEIGTPKTNDGNIDCVPVNIKVTNTAPNDTQKPLVVFTGVTVNITSEISDVSHQMWAHTGGTRKRYELEFHPIESAWFQDIRRKVVGFDKFPKITQDEERHGHVLFPGEAFTYKFLVPEKDFQHCKFHVEGNISRRHLFHLKNEL